MGLATARELATRLPQMKIALVEKEKQLGEGWALDDKGNVTIYQSYILEVTFLKCSSVGLELFCRFLFLAKIFTYSC